MRIPFRPLHNTNFWFLVNLDRGLKRILHVPWEILAALGVPRSVFYAWRRRESLEDRVGEPFRVHEVLPEKRTAVCEFALRYPKIGYRKLQSAATQ